MSNTKTFVQEVEWVELKHRTISMEVFYGLQQRTSIEQIEKESSKLTN